MATITIEDMQRDFLTYLGEVRAGASLVITEADQPVAEIKPFVEPAAKAASRRDAELDRLDRAIDDLYDQLRDLAAEPGSRAQLEAKTAEIRALQGQAADLLDERAMERLSIDRSEGERLLAQAEALLKR